jgi:hypothetical protein
MKHINESIIGRRVVDYKPSKRPGNMYDGQDLEYGDVVTIDKSETHFIYLPGSQVRWWKYSMPIAQSVLVRFNSYFKSPPASYTCDLTHNYEFVRRVREYKNIKTPEDLKRVFDKYDIPYE